MTERVVLSASVADSLAGGRPLVALETSVLAQGLPSPRNLEAAEAMERAVRLAGAEPAWTWIAGGAVRIGAGAEDLRMLAEGEGVAKAARRDVPVLVARGRTGATTVSATVWAAARAGIEVAATGGIGGVHPGGGDVSADLGELARSPVTLVCSGPKSILDPRATVERLDELGVTLAGYRCDGLPFFLAGETDIALEHRLDGPQDAAAAGAARRDLGMASALVVCVPIPEAAAMPRAEIEDMVSECRGRATAEGIEGKALTPYLLGCLAERSGGRTLDANVSLLESNAKVAGEIAAAGAQPTGAR